MSMKYRKVILNYLCFMSFATPLAAAELAVFIPDHSSDVVRSAAQTFRDRVRSRTSIETTEIIVSGMQDIEESNAGDAILFGEIGGDTFDKLLAQLKFESFTDNSDDGFYRESIVVGETRLLIVAGTTGSGLFAGTGDLLRRSIIADNTLSLAMDAKTSFAKHPIRGASYSTNINGVGYTEWGIDEWRDYLTEIALWGSNLFQFTPYYAGQLQSADFESETFWATNNAIIRVAHSLGMKVSVKLGINDVFLDQADPSECMDNSQGMTLVNLRTADPSIPERRQLILDIKHTIFERSEPFDILFIAATDPGGCNSEGNMPWIQTYLPLAREIVTMGRQFNPDLKLILNDYKLPAKEVVWFRKELSEQPEKYDWFDYVADWTYYHPATNPGVPKPAIDFYAGFEITMRDGFGAWGANILPSIFELEYQMLRGQISGAISYSEGVHEDATRVILLRYLWDEQDKDRTLEEYIEWYFPGADSKELIELIYYLETPSFVPRYIPTLKDWVERLSGAEERYADNWRFNIIAFKLHIQYLLNLIGMHGPEGRGLPYDWALEFNKNLLTPLVMEERFDLLQDNGRYLYKPYDLIEPYMEEIRSEAANLRRLKYRVEQQTSLGKYLLVGRTHLSVLKDGDGQTIATTALSCSITWTWHAGWKFKVPNWKLGTPECWR